MNCLNDYFSVYIGIETLLDLIDRARPVEPNYRMSTFISKLEQEGYLE